MTEPAVQTSGQDTPADRLKQFAADLERRQLERRWRDRARLWKPTATAATQLGYECARRIVYQRAIPWAAEQITPELASIFTEGDLHERQVLRELEEDLGVRLVNRQTKFRDERLDLVGGLDAEVPLPPPIGNVPLEVKGLQAIPGDQVEGEDLADAPKALHRRYFSQLQIYLFLRGLPLGLFVFKSKATGRWRVIPVELDYEHTEHLLKRAELVRDTFRAYVRAFETVRPFNQDGPPQLDPNRAFTLVGELAEVDSWERALAAAEPALPERLASRAECGQCPFRKHCNPSQAAVDPALIATDEDLIAKLGERDFAAPYKRVFERLHEEIRTRFLATAGDEFLAGGFVIRKVPRGEQTVVKITRIKEKP